MDSTKNTHGLANLGATCYVNTVVQCLGYCPSFLKFMLEGPRPHDRATPLADELRDVYQEIWLNGNAIAPRKFVKSLQDSLGSYINIFEQNDIAEFLILYLDKLNTDLGTTVDISEGLLENIRKQASTYANAQYGELAYQMDINWINAIKKEYSPIMDIFYGQLISQIMCGKCHKIHHNYETYNSMCVPISQHATLEEAIHLHLSDEVVNNKEDMLWKCDKCNECAPSKKSIKLWRNPHILAVTIKRFDYTLRKNNQAIRAPLHLDLTSYSINPASPSKYKLVSVGIHCGMGLGFGHYNCCCRHTSGKWFVADDANVWEASDREVEFALNQGYMYFYERE